MSIDGVCVRRLGVETVAGGLIVPTQTILGDEHKPAGVKKEFFQLLIAQLFDPCYGMFKTTDSRYALQWCGMCFD